jgi:hypothetical protein
MKGNAICVQFGGIMKMIKTRKMLAFLSLLLMSFQAKAERADVVVRLPPELDVPAPKPLSPQERERKELYDRVSKRLPYVNEEFLVLGTLGQLTKLCDWVFVGKVVDTQGSKVAAGAKEEFLGDVSVTLNIETNLFGRMWKKRIVVTPYWWETWRVPKAGDRMLVFLAKERYDKYVSDVMEFDFDKAKLKGETSKGPIVVQDCRGMIGLGSAETERIFVAATEGYLQVLRRESRDAERYYALLRQLVLSPEYRIKEDARSDLLKFLRSCPSFDLDRVLADENIDEGIKDYIRLILRPRRKPPEQP